MFDFHLHLARFPQVENLVQLMSDHGYSFIAIACEPWEWEKLIHVYHSDSDLKNHLAFGIHPQIAAQVNDSDVMELRKYLEIFPNAQVGEAGLDKRFPGYGEGEAQERIFVAQAKLALELERDLQIHCVGDYGRILRLLKEAGFKDMTRKEKEIQQRTMVKPESEVKAEEASDIVLETVTKEKPLVKLVRPMFHRFGGDANFVKAALPLGAMFSLHADSFKKKATKEAISEIPENRVFFETDADESFIKELGETATAKEIFNKLVEDLESVRLAYANRC